MLVRATVNCFFSSAKECKLVVMVIFVWVLVLVLLTVLLLLLLLQLLLLLLVVVVVQIVGKVDEKVEGLGLREYLAPGGEIQGTTTTMSCES